MMRRTTYNSITYYIIARLNLHSYTMLGHDKLLLLTRNYIFEQIHNEIDRLNLPDAVLLHPDPPALNEFVEGIT